jgi:hypothetical protein
VLVNHYVFDLVDTDGTTRQVEEGFLPSVAAVLERVTKIGSRIEHPGCRIRVKDGMRSVVFVGVTTGTSPQELLAAGAGYRCEIGDSMNIEVESIENCSMRIVYEFTRKAA